MEAPLIQASSLNEKISHIPDRTQENTMEKQNIEPSFAPNNDKLSRPTNIISAPVTIDTKPCIPILAMGDDDSLSVFESTHGEFIDSLTNNRAYRGQTLQGALKVLSEDKSLIIIAVDQGLTVEKNSAVLKVVKEYAATRGVVIFESGGGDEWLSGNENWFKED